jgi:pyridoxine kinase
MTQQHPDLAAEQDFIDHAYRCLEVSRDAAWRIATPLIGFDIAPNGTGDAVAALFTAHWIESGDVALALGKAASSIFAVLEATSALGERELQLVAAQDGLVAPSRRFTAEKL